MPAKPLQSVRRNATFVIDSGAVRKHPELAALMACVITEWARVEANLGTVLMLLTGAKAIPAAAMYGSLKSPQARTDTLMAVARVTLSEDTIRIFEAVLAYLREGVNIRNRLTHGLWGTAKQIPDALLVVDADVELARQRDLTPFRYDPALIDKKKAPRLHPKDIFVYFKADFEEALQVIEQCYLYTQSLCVLCYPQTAVGDPTLPASFLKGLYKAADRTQDELRNDPRLQKKLGRASPPSPPST